MVATVSLIGFRFVVANSLNEALNGIEFTVTSGGLDKLAIYAGLGISEV